MSKDRLEKKMHTDKRQVLNITQIYSIVFFLPH